MRQFGRGNFFCGQLIMLAAFSFLVAVAGNATAAQTADLSGVVVDSTHAAVAGARVVLTKENTGSRKETSANEEGLYRFAFLAPGGYDVSVEANGFTSVSRTGIKLDPAQQANLDFTLTPATVKQQITVTEASSSVQTISPALGTEVDRTLVQNLPLNGRTFQSLVALVPGVVTPTTLNQTVGGQAGIFINGQRSTTNYVMVDGVSANVAMNASPIFPGSATGGNAPALTVLGTTHNLVSVDDMQEFKLQTSTYSAAYGRAGGGQLEIVTRSGTNEFHGAAFDYFRNEALDGNDWFSNAAGVPRAAHRQNDFGGTFGGPLWHDRTFFFASYEGLRLLLPQTLNTQVPSMAARQSATGAIQQLMNAFPVPTGATNPATMLAPFIAASATRASANNGSFRVDQIVSPRVVLFARYTQAPSITSTQTLVLGTTEANYRSVTIGATATLSPTVTTDMRVNYSRDEANAETRLTTFGGAVPPADSLLFPSAVASSRTSSVSIIMGSGANLIVGRSADNIQHQTNIVSNSSMGHGQHDIKFGVDYRYLDPHYGPFDYRQQIAFRSVNRALTGVALNATVSSFQSVDVAFHDVSLYGEDSWRVHPRLTLNYGLRWELNPAPHAQGGQPLVTLSGFPDLSAMTLAPSGTPVYETRYTNFAPRFGAAYEMRQQPGREVVIRGGFGIFYDLGIGNIGNAATSFPYLNTKRLAPAPYPLTSQAAAPPPTPSLSPPYTGTFNIFAPDHTLPRSYQWNLTVDQRLGTKQLLAISYVGELGRKLLRESQLTDPNSNFSGSFINVTSNTSYSDYHALQLQLQRRVVSGLAALGSYTWSHSTDDTSLDEGFNDLAVPKSDHGASDFDVRHSFSLAFSYEIPPPNRNRFLRVAFGNWSVAEIFVARTALPVNVYVERGDVNPADPTLNVDAGQVRPDRVPGVPLYISDATVPGGRRINAAAFSVPLQIRQGDLGRNTLRGFPLVQFDAALWREFGITEKTKLQFRLDSFNVFNHPNFGAIDSNLGFFGPPLQPNGDFGTATALLANTGGPIGLYNAGGPRSLQLAIRLHF